MTLTPQPYVNPNPNPNPNPSPNPNQARRAGELPRARAAYAAGVAALEGEPLAFFALHGARSERRTLTLTLNPNLNPNPKP